jgi:hypothetical protein
VIPDPDSIVAVVLHSDELSSQLGDDQPIRFRYWNEPGASPNGSVGGRDYEIAWGAGAYIVVLSVTPSEVEVQAGQGLQNAVRAKVDLSTGAVTVTERWP